MIAGEGAQAIMHDGVRSSAVKINEVAMCGECSTVKSRDALVARRLTRVNKMICISKYMRENTILLISLQKADFCKHLDCYIQCLSTRFSNVL